MAAEVGQGQFIAVEAKWSQFIVRRLIGEVHGGGGWVGQSMAAEVRRGQFMTAEAEWGQFIAAEAKRSQFIVRRPIGEV
eukprot:CAMPEP_0201871670 /NCGR_PEP_ID=MMETSP0902-20130614/4548_1 /ASSEMBLY_ACC=CAM_ASM_000551 /TAXON_ID=420261 /ORGANISM="Thalassiosira antarctica, Strain CCMP982" /LENGTH=78 /DNA_ID=CAMNT_0048397727 /DNA_START=159 /DNA_END=392 /DNA_ORIENTATION=+